MSWLPDWYALIQDAKYLGVKPWELLEQGFIWRVWAQKAISAENYADEERKKHGKY